MRPWLVASVRPLRAMGSWTLVMIWVRLEPAATAASTVVADTSRIPSAMILIATGAANITAATIAVNRVGPNSARNGTRYTNGGIVWPASRAGRMTRSARRLRPIQTPNSTPRIIVITLATRVDASVPMLSCHSPEATSRPRQIAEMTAARTLPITSDSATMASTTSHQGDSVSRDWRGSISTVVTKSFMPLVTDDRFVWTQSVPVVAAFAILVPMSMPDGNSAAHTYVRDR